MHTVYYHTKVYLNEFTTVAVIHRYQHRSRSHLCLVCRGVRLFSFASNGNVYVFILCPFINQTTWHQCSVLPPCSNGAGTMKDVNGFHVQNNKLRPIPHPIVFVSRQFKSTYHIVTFANYHWFYVYSYTLILCFLLLWDDLSRSEHVCIFFTLSLISFQRSLRTGDFENQFPFVSLKTHEKYYVCWANTNCIRAAQEAPIVTWQWLGSQLHSLLVVNRSNHYVGYGCIKQFMVYMKMFPMIISHIWSCDEYDTLWWIFCSWVNESWRMDSPIC